MNSSNSNHLTIAFVVLALILFITCSATEPPILTLLPKSDNAEVYPAESETWTQTLNYTVNCNFSMPASITLEIYNLSLHDWTTVGDETYTDAGEWQTLTWNNVKICGGKCEGTSSYRFKYNETILLTESGPIIAPPPPAPPAPKMFRNATVKPASGDYNDSFDYSVWVKLNKTTNITLEVYDISSYERRPMGEEGYSNKGEWQLLTWTGITNVSAKDSVGVASFRFFFIEAGGERHESDVFYGPYLELYPHPTPTPVIIRGGGGGGGGAVRRLFEDEEMQKELAEKLSRFLPVCEKIKTPKITSANVTPAKGSWRRSYDYWVVVEHPNKADLWLTLVVYRPSKGENQTISSRAIWEYNETNMAEVEWRDVSVFSKEDVTANETPGFYIHYYDGCNKGVWSFSCPKLNFAPVLDNCTVSLENGTYRDAYNYTVNVTDRDGDNVTVTLHVVDSGGKELYINKTNVNGTDAKNGTIVSWEYKFTEEAAGKTFRYYFNASDAFDEAEVRGTGPRIDKSGLHGMKQALLGGLSLPIIVVLAVIVIALAVIIVTLLRYLYIVLRWIRKRGKREIEEEMV